MFCTTCFGHPSQCDCGVLRPKSATPVVVHCHCETPKAKVGGFEPMVGQDTIFTESRERQINQIARVKARRGY